MTPTVKLGDGFLGCSAPGRISARHRFAHHLAAAHREQMAAAAAGTGTIFFPDVSGYQAGLRVQPGTVALLAKATEGSTFIDSSYAGFRAQAAAVGAVFAAYHFVWGGTLGEARHVHQVVGSTPLMLDVENTNVALTLADVLALVRNYRALGGVVHLAYLPRWYWESAMGSPSLVPLQQAGVQIVSSYYSGYSDGGPGWDGYGGVLPVQWQYTDAFPYGGEPVDFNAFRGTPAAYRALLTGAAPTPSPATVTAEDDMITYIQEARTAGDVGGTKHGLFPAVWKAEAGFLDWMSAADLKNSQWWASHQWKTAFDGGAIQVVDPGTLGAFGALRPGTAVPPAGQWSGAPLRGYTPTIAAQPAAAAVDQTSA